MVGNIATNATKQVYKWKEKQCMEDKTPSQLAKARISLAEEYSRYSGEWAKLVQSRAKFFKDSRPTFKSDTACQRGFELTDDGVKMEVIKAKLKSIEKLLSAYKTMLELKSNEARGLY